MDKNQNLFPIGKIAKSVGITRRIILNYEEKGLIKPDKKDGTTGNRYYTIETFTQIRTIRLFQSFGLSLDEIRNYFNDTTDLTPLIQRLKALRNNIDLCISELSERANEIPNQIKEITVSSQTVYCIKDNATTVTDKLAALTQAAIDAMHQYGTDTTKRMYFTEYALYHNEETSYCVTVPSNSKGEHIVNFPSFRAISMYHYGAYEYIANTREQLINYAKVNNIKLLGVCRQLYLEGPPQHKDKNKFITKIILPIK